ncbi:EcsC family protein [Clostridium sp. D2Q-11]|uniref:EcsC family protein n=1 Tax=Anaeromonas frigoriresistens TaxID=2683708 RepID=A0A942Z842_9FIRM|nr:EcsC family protein [Anaeromonas frigoriresistens]MBS4539392.1 EcsC family protein [Anaeromonas frigoriresistens]
MNSKFKRQLKKLNKQEKKILNKKENKLVKLKINPIRDKIESKIPDKVKNALDIAFFKGFHLVFEKGNQYIEKTYDKDKIKLEHDLNNYKIDEKVNRKHIKELDRQSRRSKIFNSSFSILEGGALGVLGIGLPDIPLFIATIMKNIYEIALSYGYDYEREEERVYILLIICGAMTQGKPQLAFNDQIDRLGHNIDQGVYNEVNLEEQIRVTSNILSDSMLAAKFVQGIPIIGAVGGIVNYNIINKIGKYASIKYKKRYLLRKE